MRFRREASAGTAVRRHPAVGGWLEPPTDAFPVVRSDRAGIGSPHMPRLVIVGAFDDTRPLLDRLPEGDYAVTVVRDREALADVVSSDRVVLMIGILGGLMPLSAVRQCVRHHPWLAWNRTDAPALGDRAHEWGALAVLPSSIGREALRTVLGTALARAQPDAGPRLGRLPHGRTCHLEGDAIALAPGDVLAIEAGIVAITVLQADGVRLLTGLVGAGDVIVGHPRDSCCLGLHAHTDVRGLIQPWDHAAASPAFVDLLRRRLGRQEAWVAVQARPRLADRLLGLLGLLAEQFGRPHQGGILIDLHLSHGQIGMAIGTTRRRVTQILGSFRKERLVRSEGPSRNERLIVRLFERQTHG